MATKLPTPCRLGMHKWATRIVDSYADTYSNDYFETQTYCTRCGTVKT